jgi:glycosyltransferase involved in cell wall biosynthesis
VIGSVADAYRTWAGTHDAVEGAVVIGGYVDDATRARAYSAADVVVLSYDAGHVRDSGVLQDALAFGRPVVCSGGSDPAAKVAEFGLGRVFEPGAADALVAAMRAAPWCALPDDTVAQARGSTSDAAVAGAHLDALDALDVVRVDQTGRK